MKHFLLNHSLEIPAVIAGLINIYLAARANIWNWLFGIITTSLYIIIFFHAKLYADMSLYFLTLGLQFYGWYEWLYGGSQHTALPVRKADKKIIAAAFILIIMSFVIIVFILKKYTDSTTVYTDAATTALSLVAQWMITKKWIENWWLWILADIIGIYLYTIKHLYLTTGLYIVFLGFCLYGYYIWKKSLLTQTNITA